MFPVTHLYLMLYISVAVSPKSRTSIPYGTLSCSILPPIPPLPLLPIHTYTPSHCLTIATLCYPLRRYSRLISKWHSHSHWAHTVHASPHCAHCTHRTLYTPHTVHCLYDTTHACCTHGHTLHTVHMTPLTHAVHITHCAYCEYITKYNFVYSAVRVLADAVSFSS